ncbi:CRISPR-associated exonuclease, Cas4 family [Paramaledivibacter caminithermalis DSM 15212]|uniref:CRISPR-associated exonuclease Cas4 n=2 Tax=Paramaledivibacter TaxID=1884934 RepID=A0A1M6KPR1_PARC5|nr:CRISPR-associated exonuclease, Cas4 family [Paramaledivibacter caminithermalis DSM 15212]
MKDMKVNGTLIWYYFICKREVWLMSHQLIPDQENSNIDIGRFLHEESYKRDKKEISLGNIIIDVMKKENGELIVGEVKKSSRFKESARMQLLYYLKELKDKGIVAKGVLMFPKEKEREEIELTKEDEKELDKVVRDILRIIYLDKPPKAIKNKYCKKCAYSELCFS